MVVVTVDAEDPHPRAGEQEIRPTHVALMFATQPLFAALDEALALGDRLGGQQLLGGLMLVAGVVVAARR